MKWKDLFTCIESVEGASVSPGPGGACAATAVCPGEQTAGTESLVGSSIPWWVRQNGTDIQKTKIGTWTVNYKQQVNKIYMTTDTANLTSVWSFFLQMARFMKVTFCTVDSPGWRQKQVQPSAASLRQWTPFKQQRHTMRTTLRENCLPQCNELHVRSKQQKGNSL